MLGATRFENGFGGRPNGVEGAGLHRSVAGRVGLARRNQRQDGRRGADLRGDGHDHEELEEDEEEEVEEEAQSIKITCDS